MSAPVVAAGKMDEPLEPARPLIAPVHALAAHVLVIADSDEGGRLAREVARCSGARAGPAIDPVALVTVSGDFGDIDVVLADLSRDLGSVTDRALARLSQAARDAIPVIVSCPIALLDRVDAGLMGRDIVVLVDPDETERVAALALMLPDRGLVLRDSARDVDAVRLRRLADEVSRIARSLSSLSAGTPTQSGTYETALSADLRDTKLGFSAEPSLLAPADPPASDDVRKVIRLRRMRDGFFDRALFADPAWDMLLDLFAAQIDGDRVAVSSLCIAAAVPPTTALRWIKTMTEHGLFERHADPFDGRRIYVRLSVETIQAMSNYFAAMKRAEGVAI